MRFRATLTCTREYEVDPTSYGTDDVEKMLQIDKDALMEDPFDFIEMSNNVVTMEAI